MQQREEKAAAPAVESESGLQVRSTEPAIPGRAGADSLLMIRRDRKGEG